MPEITHRGHRIAVTDDLMFSVTGPQFEVTELRSSVALAKEEIDKRITAAEKQAIATHRTAIPALDQNGVSITVRGVNRNAGNVLGYEKVDGIGPRLNLPEIFPAVPWIEAVLKERRETIARAAALTQKVWKYGIKASRAYGRVNPDHYDAMHAALVAEIENKTAEAQVDAPANDAA